MRFFKKFKLDEDFRLAFLDAGTIGLHLTTHTLVGAGLGWLLDRWWNSSPWALLVGIVYGFAGGVRTVYRDSKRLLGDMERLDQEKKDKEKPDKDDA